MKEKILNFVKKKESTEIARYLPLEGESWFDTYFVEVKNAFSRAWNWKFMWFWALFLTGGASFGNFTNFLPSDNSNRSEFLDSIGFVVNDYLYILITIAIVFVLFIFVILIISYVSTWGIIRSLSEIQDGGKPENDKFMEVWKKGEGGIVKLFLFSMFILLIYISFLGIIVAIPFILGITESWISYIYVLFMIPVFLLFVLICSYVSQISIVILVLENSSPIKSIKKACSLVRRSYKEIGKLIIVRILLNMFITLIAFFYIFIFAIFIGSIVLVSQVLLGFIDINEIFSIISAIGFFGFAVVMFIPFVVFGIIAKLVSLDLWIWWVKRNVPSLRKENNK